MEKICTRYTNGLCSYSNGCEGFNSNCDEYEIDGERANVHKLDYQLLDRCKSDCEYFLGGGNRQKKHLWGGNIEDHIRKMKDLYCLLPEKPEWLTFEQIEEYERRMKEGGEL